MHRDTWRDGEKREKTKPCSLLISTRSPQPLAPLMQSAVMVPRLGAHYYLRACFQELDRYGECVFFALQVLK